MHECIGYCEEVEVCGTSPPGPVALFGAGSVNVHVTFSSTLGHMRGLGWSDCP